MKKSLLLLLILTMLVAFAACGQPDAPAQDDDDAAGQPAATPGESGGIVSATIAADTPTMDPQGKTPTTVSAAILNHMLEGLVRIQGNEVLPGMAERWEISDDGLIYTFHLRDAKWSDGVAVTANDFVYAFRRLVDPQTASNNALQGYYIANGRAVNNGELPVEELGVQALDEKTVEVTLEAPTAYFLSLCGQMFFYPTRQDICEQQGTAFASSADTNVYNGPFLLTDWRVEDKVVLSKNPDYWNADAVRLDGIEFLVVGNADTAAAMFDAGQVDFVSTISTAMLPLYEEQVVPYDNGRINYIRFNLDGSNAVTANLNFRKAFAAAFDRTEFSALLSGGRYTPNGRFTVPTIAGAQGNYTDEHPYDFPVAADLDAAQAYLQDALGELGLSGADEITLEILVKDTEEERKLGAIVQDMMLKNLGIQITVRSLPMSEWLVEHKEHTYELISCSNGPDYNDPYTHLELYVSDSSYNHASYFNAQYDDLLTQANAEADAALRMSLLFEAEQLLIEDVVGVPTVVIPSFGLLNPALQHVRLGFQSPSPDFVYAYFSE